MKTKIHLSDQLKQTVKTSAPLLGILFVSAALRMYNISAPAVLDEPFTLYVAKLAPPQIVATTAGDTHPPLYYLVLHYWVLLFQDSELVTRLPSVVFSVLAVFVVYRIGERLFNRDVGLLGALFAGLSVFQITEAQNTRMYSLLGLLALLSMYAFIRLHDKMTWTSSLAYVAATVALLYTHAYGVFIVIAQNLFILSVALVTKERVVRLRRWLTLQLIVVVLFAPWIVVLPTQRADTGAYGWNGTPDTYTLLSNIFGYTGDYTGALAVALIFALCSLGAVLTWKRVQGAFRWRAPVHSLTQYRWMISIAADYKVLLLLLWLLVPNVLPFLYSYISGSLYGEETSIYGALRYTIPASAALYVLAARGITSVRQGAFKLGVIAVIMVLSVTSVASYYAIPSDDTPYRAVAAYVDAHAQPGDLVLFINRPTADYISHIDMGFNAYSKRTDLHKVTFPAAFYDKSDEEQIQTLNATVQHAHRVWVFCPKDTYDYLLDDSALGSVNWSYPHLSENFTYDRLFLVTQP